MNDALATAAALGITVCCTTGNWGPTDGFNDGRPHVHFPAASPHVLAIGSTRISANENRIETEVVLNGGSDTSVAGGGFSDVFPVPVWQKGIAVSDWDKSGKPRGRGLPDVAAHGAGCRLFIKGEWTDLGGGGTPLWCALIARINQGLGQRVGLLSPVLYQNLGPAGFLRDITEGSTRMGGPDNLGHDARPGWDPCTGWGTPNGRLLLNALKLLQTTQKAEHHE
jgi:kumamolisin